MKQGRRRFLAALGTLAAAAGAAIVAVPVIGGILWPVARVGREVWQPVGRLEDFPVGSTRIVRYVDPDAQEWAGFAARSGAWLRREDEDRLVALSMYCTHVGCPVRWEEEARLFLCPCHGGVFLPDGSVASGPPRLPLPHLPVRVRDGQVEIQATARTPVPEPE